MITVVRRGHAQVPDPRPSPLRVVGTNPAMGLLNEAVASRRAPRDPRPPAQIQRCHNGRMIGMMCRGYADMAVHGGPLDMFDLDELKDTFSDHGPFAEIPVAWFTVAVVVHPGVGIRSLTDDQIGRICTGKVSNWKQLGGSDRKIVLVGQNLRYNSGDILRRTAYYNQQLEATLVEKTTKRTVVETVKKTPGAIGYFLHDWKPIDGLRPLAVAGTNDEGEPIGEPAELSRLAAMDGRYPLVDPLIVVFHPDAPQEAYDFVEFLKSETVAEIAEQRRLLTAYHKQEIERDQRLAAFKKGEGVPIKTVGPRAGLEVMRALAAEYVKASEVIQMPYVARTQELAVRDFCDEAADYEPGTIPYKPRAELILLDGKLGRPTDKYFGAWKIRANPGWHFEMGRIGVAVVAHKTNPVDWLSMDELREVYTNRIGEWSELERASSLKAGLQRNKIQRFGLKSGQPVFQVFVDKTLDGRPISRFTQRDTTEEVIASVALDPGAVGFVSLTDLKPNENRVKILGIVPKEGDGFPETIGPHGPTEDYPLQQRWSLQLHAVASEETQRFVEFVTTDERASQVLRDHGLIPAGEITAEEETKKVGEKPMFVVPE